MRAFIRICVVLCNLKNPPAIIYGLESELASKLVTLSRSRRLPKEISQLGNPDNNTIPRYIFVCPLILQTTLITVFLQSSCMISSQVVMEVFVV